MRGAQPASSPSRLRGSASRGYIAGMSALLDPYRALARYNAWMNQKLYAAVAQLCEARPGRVLQVDWVQIPFCTWSWTWTTSGTFALHLHDSQQQ